MTETIVRNDWAQYTEAVPPALPVSSDRRPPPLTAIQVHNTITEFVKAQTQWTQRTGYKHELVLRKFEKHLAGQPMTWTNFKNAFEKLCGELSGSSTERYRKILRAWELWMVGAGMTVTVFTRLIRKPKIIQKIRIPVTYEEYLALRGHAEGSMIYLMDALWMTGLALVDVYFLEWKHVDLKQMIVNKHRHKTKGACTIPIIHGSNLHLALEKKFVERESTVGEWPSTNGKHYVDNQLALWGISDSSNGAHRRFRQITKALGMRDILLHDFRATFCTAAMAVSDPITVCAVTGHADPSQLDPYVTVSLDKLRKTVEDADRWAKGNK